MLNSETAFTSQASWIFLNEKSSVAPIGHSQGVENGQGSLKVEADWERPPARLHNDPLP